MFFFSFGFCVVTRLCNEKARKALDSKYTTEIHFVGEHFYSRWKLNSYILTGEFLSFLFVRIFFSISREHTLIEWIYYIFASPVFLHFFCTTIYLQQNPWETILGKCNSLPELQTEEWKKIVFSFNPQDSCIQSS